MPELPEVETIRRQLEKKIVGKKLAGNKITKIKRRAKILMIEFEDGKTLAFHLKLTGQLIFNGQPSPHTRKVFNFDDGTKLLFNDMRKFGWWKILKDTSILEKELGPEALGISMSTFFKLLARRPNAKIKTLLMDQKFIAGIGNIYSDEILFAAKVHPLRLVKTLSEKEAKSIFQNIKKILKKAILHRGSSVGDYIDAGGKKGDFSKYHKVYRREKKNCILCGNVIKRVKIGGRSAHFCEKCQS